MSCSFCVEFCPFDAIKMNHDYELAVYDRYPQLVYDKEEPDRAAGVLRSDVAEQFAAEQEALRKAEEEERAKAEAKAKAAEATKPASPPISPSGRRKRSRR